VDGVDDTCGPAKGSKVGVWKGVGKMGVFESAVKMRCIEEEEEKGTERCAKIEDRAAPLHNIIIQNSDDFHFLHLN
jgi:hypothetical protein